MAGAGDESRKQPKAVSVSELDDWFYAYAQSEQGRREEMPLDEDDEDERAVVLLPYGMALALDLWRAWRDKNTMAVAGGYLDQPRAWVRLIRYFDSRYTRMYQQAKADHADEHYWEEVMGKDAEYGDLRGHRD